LGFGGEFGELEAYFLTSCECSGYLRFICGYVLTSGIGGEWSSGYQISLTGC